MNLYIVNIINFLMINSEVFIKMLAVIGLAIYLFLNGYYHMMEILRDENNNTRPKNPKDNNLLDDDL